MPERDVKFDGLRVIGLLAIILAHVGPPALLFQIRNFDVPLMVLVSGAVYGLSSGTNKKYLSYIWGRIMRLLLPTWTFLLIFFSINFVSGNYFSNETILKSFALLDGIGYVWIIRVFILVAFIAPFFVFLYHKLKNRNIYLFSVLLIFIFYNLLHRIYVAVPVLHTNIVTDFIFQMIIFYLLPFGCVAGLGLYLLKASKTSTFLLALFFSSVFVFLAFKYSVHDFVQTQLYKYPPGIYYLAYALAVSLLLYLVSFARLFQKIFRTRLLQFIAFSSLWIYLWQIFFIYQWGFLEQYTPFFLNNFVGKFIIILSFSVLTVFLQRLLVKYIVSKVQHTFFKHLLTLAFLK